MADAPFSRDARRAERARIARLSRLPFLYDFSQRSPRAAAAAVLLQVLLVVAVTLGVAKLLTGEFLLPFVAFAVLVVAFSVQAVSRYLNAKAGRS